MGLGPLIEVVQNIFDMSWKSGIQILLFLAGLQTISPQMYEVANVEGATAWEKFWKITFPLLTPILLLNVVYTIIDSFTDFSNQTMRIIMDYAQHMRIGYGSALAIIYFVIVFLVAGGAYLLIKQAVACGRRLKGGKETYDNPVCRGSGHTPLQKAGGYLESPSGSCAPGGVPVLPVCGAALPASHHAERFGAPG